MDYVRYLNEVYRHITMHSKLPSSFMVYRLCSVHLMKNFVNDISQSIEDDFAKKALKGFLYTIFSITVFEKLFIWAADFFTILLCEYECLEVDRSISCLKKHLREHEVELTDLDMNGKKKQEIGPKYQESLFYKDFENVFKTVEVHVENINFSGTKNNFYSPRLARSFLKNHSPYMALMTPIVPTTFNSLKHVFTNNNVDGFLSVLKQSVLGAVLTAGKMPVKYGRFWIIFQELNRAYVKQYTFKMTGNEKCSSKRKRQDQVLDTLIDAVSDHEEMWRTKN